MDEHRLTSEEWINHLKKDEEFQEAQLNFNDKVERVLFGDDINELGMKAKVDEMHELLTQAKNVGGFFGSIGGFGRWIFTIIALISMFKLWGISILSLLGNK
jgi:hypothetical protein